MAEHLTECLKGFGHQWVPANPTEFSKSVIGWRLKCEKCSQEMVWKLKETPNPENAPGLGEWRTI